MTKVIGNAAPLAQVKKGSTREHTHNPVRVFETGLNRRAFLRSTCAMALLAGLVATKPQLAQASNDDDAQKPVNTEFDAQAKAVIVQVQSHLFPADGDGPSAADLQAFEYLRWALTDPDNLADGDQAFILQGVGWLEELASTTQGDSFLKLDLDTQAKLMEKIARSRAGENWLSLLLYYLLEALTLDPVYGGNPDGVGWKWLQHQPGFPAPIVGKTYRDFS